MQIDQKDRQTMGQMDGQMVRVQHSIIDIQSQINRQTATPLSASLTGATRCPDQLYVNHIHTVVLRDSILMENDDDKLCRYLTVSVWCTVL